MIWRWFPAVAALVVVLVWSLMGEATHWPAQVREVGVTLQTLEATLDGPDWPEAERQVERLHNQWSVATGWLLVNGDESVVGEFSALLAHFESAVAHRDLAEAHARLSALQALWPILTTW